MKEKVVIFGAGDSGKKLYEKYQKEDSNIEIVAFADNFKNGTLYNLPILSPEDLLDYGYDSIIIASVAAGPIREKLLEIGIPAGRVSSSYIEVAAQARDVFLKRAADEIHRKNLSGAVAEAGVFQGDFAKLINRYFPEKDLYLFDTFTGFDERDILVEEGYEKDPERGEHFKQTSVNLVMSKMPHPENVIIKQGYVPETFAGLEEKFCFVNLDMDLYQPTLAALEWFWPRMVDGGVILIHDYFDETGTFPNLKKAVIRFTEKNHINSIPIGDDLSIALLKSETI